MKKSRRLVILVLGTLALAAMSACTSSKSGSSSGDSVPVVQVPNISGPSMDAGSVPVGKTEVVRLSNGAEILVPNVSGKLFFLVEGTFAPESFAKMKANLASKPVREQNEFVQAEIATLMKQAHTLGGVAMSSTPEIGFFSFLMPYSSELMASLKGLKTNHSIYLNPVAYDRESLKQIKGFTPESEGLVARTSMGRDDQTAFSGLARMHAPEFVELAQKAIGDGSPVNGSSVKVGITDTGITFNHPTFMSSDGSRNRIEYMKDFTREGRIYFHPRARFDVKQPAGLADDELVINAQLILTPRLPNQPTGDQFTEPGDIKIKVSPELKALLTQPGASGAKFGVLLEDSLQGDSEAVDINANGKLDDRFMMILIPGVNGAGDQLVVDFSGTADFRRARALGDWNTTHDTLSVFAEKIGFSILDDKLMKTDGSDTVELKSVSIVGFDPGNHGSHVAGIAAGNRTIKNDLRSTLARGVAPEASIMMNRVCANNGGCGADQAIIDLALHGAEVINMSLGGLSPFNDGYGVQETIINRLTQYKNVLFVISAGNSGPGRQTVGSPSVARLSLSVGAAASRGMIQRQYQWPGVDPVNNPEDDTDFMLFFSSRGPTAAGGFKPNLSAPGTELSSIQLNSAPGARAGLDVYWGTSMAAPSATGAYALLLDAVKKFNAAHPEKQLPTAALTLRQVLISSARPFDQSRFDPATGQSVAGKYTWIDEGTGMIDLVAAWNMLQALVNDPAPSLDLDYQVIVSSDRNPSGNAYNGTRLGTEQPVFGTGLYLSPYSRNQLIPVSIERRLPEPLAAGPNAGELTRELLTTADEFVLKTTIFGSSVEWIKAGVLDQVDCTSSPTSNLTVIGRGVEIVQNEDGSSSLVQMPASTLNMCVNRALIETLAPGDHGALVEGFRIVDGKVATIPSFTLPVYMSVPHQTLAGSSAYEINSSVASFDVSRNYIAVPEGTSLVRLTLEVPAVKTDARGGVAPGEICSGVELMALKGVNNASVFKSRAEARVSNCGRNGNPITDPAKRTISVNITNPKPGMWDLHVFGQYRFKRSKFKLRADYVTAVSSIKSIEGDLSALKGSLNWNITDASMSVSPSNEKSEFTLQGLFNKSTSQVKQHQFVIVEGQSGILRKYGEGTTGVILTTGGAKGNDLDLTLIECLEGATQIDDPSCIPVAGSGGSTDEELIRFTPKKGKVYAARVDGYDVKDDGYFDFTETILLPMEYGALNISTPSSGAFKVDYSFTDGQIASSRILNHSLFVSGVYSAVGSLTLKTEDEITLAGVPLRIAK